MKNKEKLYNVEDHFDQIFANKKKYIDRKFTYHDVGIKDKKIINILNQFNIENKNCLDIGPGSGRWLNYFKLKKANSISAVDISEKVLDLCHKYCDDTQKLNLENEKLKFNDNYFDLVVAFEVIEHLRDPDLFIREILRVSKKNALIIISLPNILSFVSRLRVAVGFLPSAILADETHVGFYNQKRLIKLFKNYNQKINFKPTSFSLSPFNRKSFFKIPSNSFTSNLDDSHLIYFYSNK